MFNSKYIFLKGFLSATILLVSAYLIINPKVICSTKPYIILKSNYKIEGAGFLQKGTVLQVDEGMSEGFTRFILYLNMKGGEYEKYPNKENVIIPYWLNK
jgi:hypothetical protein